MTALPLTKEITVISNQCLPSILKVIPCKRRLDPVTIHICQGSLSHFAMKVGLLLRPGPEANAETS